MTINGIPWNPVLADPGIVFDAPPPGEVDEWKRILMQEFGINTTIRQEKGQEISAACGQLAVKDIEDLGMPMPAGDKFSAMGVQGLATNGCA